MSSDVNREPTPAELPRGRHNLPLHVVRASQRERLLQAMLELVGEQGWEGTTVPEVVARARVSRNAFYELWRDKTDCFIALCDELTDAMFDDISRPQGDDWMAALRSGMRRYLEWWQERPAFSRTYFVELPLAGRRALDQRDRQYPRFRTLFDQLAGWARAQDPSLPPLRPLATRAVVLSVTELVAEEVRAGRADRLEDLEDELVALIATLLAAP